jgi:hypothetical protein
MKKVLTIIFLVSIFFSMKSLLYSSSYHGPQVTITGKPDYLLPNQTGTVDFEITFPIEEGTDIINGSFDVKGTLPPGEKVFLPVVRLVLHGMIKDNHHLNGWMKI